MPKTMDPPVEVTDNEEIKLPANLPTTVVIRYLQQKAFQLGSMADAMNNLRQEIEGQVDAIFKMGEQGKTELKLADSDTAPAESE